ncbi:hypothetical protein FJ489_31035 [Mesorhizobium sp. B2-5-12]|nr:hypothetical protein FJ489_31035 [Mesorhizobium sp. B2-5-12]TPK19206.1 hypothetical protein FJ562_31440 [Mesorhizobium sp. B2-5-6]
MRPRYCPMASTLDCPSLHLLLDLAPRRAFSRRSIAHRTFWCIDLKIWIRGYAPKDGKRVAYQRTEALGIEWRIVMPIGWALAALDAFKAHTYELAVYIAIVRTYPADDVNRALLKPKRNGHMRRHFRINTDNLHPNVEGVHGCSPERMALRISQAAPDCGGLDSSWPVLRRLAVAISAHRLRSARMASAMGA